MKPQQADAHKQPAHPPAITVTPFAGIRPTYRMHEFGEDGGTRDALGKRRR